METSLSGFMNDLGEPGEFRIEPVISKDEDTLTMFFESKENYAERVDNFLTVYRSIDNENLIGFMIKGVTRIMSRLERLKITVHTQTVHVNLILMACSVEVPQKRTYYDRLIERSANLGDIERLQIPKGDRTG